MIVRAETVGGVETWHSFECYSSIKEWTTSSTTGKIVLTVDVLEGVFF